MVYVSQGVSAVPAYLVDTLGNPLNGTFYTLEERALRDGRVYTISTGLMTIAAGNFGGLYLANPAGSGRRVFITDRLFSCDLPSNVIQSKFAGTSNPTTNLPPTVVTASNRGVGAASVITAKSGVTNAVPSGGSTPVGNILGGGYVDLPFDRTLEPGASFENYITGVSTGLGGTDMQAVITFAFYEEAI